MTPTATASITPVRLPRHAAGAAALFDAAALPVLSDTAAAIEKARLNEDVVDAHLLAQIVSADPLMTLKLLSHVGLLRRGRDSGEPETVTAALVMLGISPFFRQFAAQSTVEARLAGSPAGLAGFLASLQRCHRAANFAAGFAAQRLDRDVAVIHCAALLHDFGELLLWLSAPDAAADIARRKRADPQLRTAQAEQDVLGFTLPELQHALMLRWQLPQLLSRIADDSLHNDSAQVRNVLLAVQLARHTSRRWDDPALHDDIHEIAALLNLGTEPTRRLLLALDS
jgi:HD-like signal output (HDOD) protein